MFQTARQDQRRGLGLGDAGALTGYLGGRLGTGFFPDLMEFRGSHGVPELSAMLAGKLTETEASTRAILATGQYTKRQATWFRHHELAPPERTYIINARFDGLTQFSESEPANFFAFLDFIR